VSRRLLPVLVAWCAALSACGGGGSGHAATTPRRAAAGSGSGGRILFTQACGACHTLSGHNDPRHQGGDLRNFHSSRTQLYQLASEMPIRRPLSRAQLDAVVRFVMSVEAGRS